MSSEGKDFTPTNCETMFDRALDNLKAMVEESGAVVSHDALPIVMADDWQMTQLFQNLISNAIKFCGEEPPSVHVSAEKKENAWLFSVQDNGIGIDPEHLERIFMIFLRLRRGRLSWNRYWSFDLQEDCGTPRRAHLGGL